MSLPLPQALDLIEGVMMEAAWKRDVLRVLGGDPDRVADLLSRAGERNLFK